MNRDPTTPNAKLVKIQSKDSKKRNYSKKNLQMALKCQTPKLQNSICSQKFIKKVTLVNQ